MRVKVAFSVLILMVCIAAYFSLDWVLDQHGRFLPNGPDEIVINEGHSMPALDVMMAEVFPDGSVGPISRFLLSRRTSTVRAMLFIVASIVGWCGSVWVRTFNVRRTGDPFLPSLLVAALFGLIAYLLVKLLETPLTAVLRKPYEAMLLLPVLAGLLTTIFYEELQDILKALMRGVKNMIEKIFGGSSQKSAMLFVWGVSLLIGASNVHAASPLKFYRCFNPKEPVCTATTEAGKAKCPHACTQWVEFIINRQWFSAKLLADGPGSNLVLANASEELYGFRPTNPQGVPPKTSEVWRNPEKYKFVQVAPKDAAVGTLVVLPHLTGVVVEPSDKTSDIRVVYASSKLGGKANEEFMEYLLDDKIEPKFIKPMTTASK